MTSRFSIVLLFTSLLLVPAVFAPNAHAYAIRYATSPLESLAASDSVTVDLYLDADQGLQLLSIGVLWETSRLSFDPLASSSASYILYTPSPPPGQAGQVDRVRDPWVEWPGDKPPGFSQVNIDYWTATSTSVPPAAASGSNIWLTSLVFHVDDASGGPPQIQVTLGTSSNILRSNDVVIDPSMVPITLIPEAGTGALLALGLAGVVASGRRRDFGGDSGQR